MFKKFRVKFMQSKIWFLAVYNKLAITKYYVLSKISKVKIYFNVIFQLDKQKTSFQ